MSARRRLVAVVSATALSLPAVSVAAGSAAGMPIPLPDPRPHLRLVLPRLDTDTTVLTELSELKHEYATGHLPQVHNAIVLILNNTASAVL